METEVNVGHNRTDSVLTFNKNSRDKKVILYFSITLLFTKKNYNSKNLNLAGY